MPFTPRLWMQVWKKGQSNCESQQFGSTALKHCLLDITKPLFLEFATAVAAHTGPLQEQATLHASMIKGDFRVFTYS